MSNRLVLMVLLLMMTANPSMAAEPVNLPSGAQALFNGKDFQGWHGMGHFSPYDLRAMSDEERAKKRADDLKGFEEHWTIENGELVNDGHGP